MNARVRILTAVFERIAIVAVAGILVLSCSVMPKVFADSGEETLNAVAGEGDEHYVVIYDGEEKYSVLTDAVSVAEVLARLDIEVGEYDSVEPSVDAAISSENFNINIHRARPVLVIDGAVSLYVYSTAYSPKEVAEGAGFTVYDGDEVSVGATTAEQFLATGAVSAYTIIRNGGRTVTVEETIAYSEEVVYDPTLATGTTEVEQIGEDGVRVLTYQVNFVDGEEVARELTGEEVVKEPVAKITRIGAKSTVSGTCADWAREAGVAEADLEIALYIINRESGCRVNATNSSSGAYGIPQALPGSNMATAGSDWQTNPVTQIRWMITYVNGRYGGWSGALEHWNTYHWY